jgi:hypothetical protein
LQSLAFQNADKRSIALPTLQTVGVALTVASLFTISRAYPTAACARIPTMVFIFSPRPNIREYIGVESTLTVITGKSSPVLKLAAKQGSHQSQQVREIAEFSRNNKIISHSCVRQAALKEKQHQRPIRMPGFKPVV